MNKSMRCTTGRFPWCVQLVGAVLLGGCWAAGPLAAEAVRHVHEPPTATAPHPQSQPIPGELTLEQLEQLALERNPTLVQAAARIEAAAQRKLQAGLYPNPVIGYDGQEISERASGGEHGGFVEQTLVTAGKLGLSRRVFEQEEARAEAQAEGQRLRVLNNIRLLYYETLGAQQLLTLRERLGELAREATEITQQLINVGQADRPDLLQAEIEARQAQLARETARNGLDQVWRRLAAVVGAAELERRPLAGTLEETVPDLTWEGAVASLFEGSPELKVAEAQVRRAEAALKRAQVEWIPNVTVRLGVHYNFERFAPGNQVVGPEGFAEVRVPLPVFDRNQGNVGAAHADLNGARLEVQRVELSLQRRLSAAYADYLTQRQTVETYRTHILDDARQAYEMYLQRYRQMAAAYPQVLIAQRTLFQAQAAYVTALAGLWRSVAEIRGLLLLDGLAAPGEPSERPSDAPGVEVESAALPSAVRAVGPNPGRGIEP